MKKVLYFILFAAFIAFTGCSYQGLNSSVISDVYSSSESKNQSQNSSADGRDIAADSTNLSKDNEKSSDGKKAADGAKIKISAYYKDTQGLLIPITRKIDKTEGIARAVVLSLIDNVANREELAKFGVAPVLPKQTEVRGLSIKGRTALIDFNENLLDYKDKEEEENIIASLVYSLSEFQTIDNVKILIKGINQKKLKFGTDISGILNRDNILINSNKVNLSNGMTKLNIFYIKSLNNKSICVLPVSKEFNVVKTELLPEKIIEFLSDNTSDSRYYSEVPSETKLISSKINGELLTLNFNDGFVKYGGNTREEGIIMQLLNSMKQIKGIKKVKILINGKTGNLPEGTDISKAFDIPLEVNS